MRNMKTVLVKVGWQEKKLSLNYVSNLYNAMLKYLKYFKILDYSFNNSFHRDYICIHTKKSLIFIWENTIHWI